MLHHVYTSFEKNTIFLSYSRTNGERCCPIQCSAEADPASADGQTLPCAALCATSRFPCHAPSDAVPGSACYASFHDAPPKTEPHHSHSETSWAGPSGDPPGKRVPVREGTRGRVPSIKILYVTQYLYSRSYIQRTGRKKKQDPRDTLTYKMFFFFIIKFHQNVRLK